MPASSVRVVRDGDGFELRVDGAPFRLNGVGGTTRLDQLARLGGNCVRTWSTRNIEDELERAERHGIRVVVGIRLEIPVEGADYEDESLRQAQVERVREIVTRYKDRAGVLAWALGNEIENPGNDIDAVWTQVETLTQVVKGIDPHHPVLAVVAELGDGKLQRIDRLAPSLDFLGINAYGGAASLPERIRATGWSRPWALTEFGPIGPWESPMTEWRAAIEESSTRKADRYDAALGAISADSTCLGSFGFFWGHKQEVTPTWFGLFLPTGEATQAVEALSADWAQPVRQHAPRIESFRFHAAQSHVDPNAALDFTIDAFDPNSDGCALVWELRREQLNAGHMGLGETSPVVLATRLCLDPSDTQTFRAPKDPGPYRLYVRVVDETGRAATANQPFYVNGSDEKVQTPWQ